MFPKGKICSSILVSLTSEAVVRMCSVKKRVIRSFAKFTGKHLCQRFFLTADDEYSRSNRKNLLPPIQRQLSKKLNTFSQFFIAFLECKLNLEHFEKKKNEPHSSSISEVIDSERRAYLNV